MAENVTYAPLTSIQNDTTAVNTINSNFQLTANALADCLSLTGNQPNSLKTNLDANFSQILNLPAPGSVNSPVRLQDVVNPSVALTVPPTGTSGAVVPFLNGNNTWSGTNTFTNTTTIPFTQTGSSHAETVDSKLKQSVSVIDYGADPTGVADSQPAIVQAMANASSVFFPPGVYLLGTNLAIPSNISLWAIPGTVTIHIPFNINQTAYPTHPIYSSNSPSNGSNTNISLQGLIFLADGISQTVASTPVMINVTNLIMEYCQFKNFGNASVYNQGFIAFGLINPILTNNKFTGCSGDGFGINTTIGGVVSNNQSVNNNDYGIVGVGCTQTMFNNNYVNGAVNVGIGLDACSDCTIVGNAVTNTPIAIRVLHVTGDNKGVAVVGNSCYLNTNTDISIEQSSNVTVTGNSCRNTPDGIHIIDCLNCCVTGNSITTTTLVSNDGIVLNTFSGHICGNNSIVGNSISGSYYGIREINSGGTLGVNLVSSNLINATTTAYGIVSMQPLSYNNGVWASSGLIASQTSVAPPAGGTVGYALSSTAGLGVYFGSGLPTVSAAQGSLYLRTDGSSGTTRAYINTTGSTTWTPITTSA